MRKLKVFRQVLHYTGADKIWASFLALFFLCALIIWLREPGIHTYGEAVWYCYAVATTIGFGDVIAEYLLSRILSVVLSITAVLVIALVTGVIVNYYNEIIKLRNKDIMTEFMDKLERLPELSAEELEELSQRVKKYRLKYKVK